MKSEHCGKILVAEDDRFITQLYSTQLGKAGFDLVMVSDGRDVVPHMLREKPDLVLLPGPPGRAFFCEIAEFQAS